MKMFRLTSKFDLRRLCRTVGAQAQARIVSCFSPKVLAIIKSFLQCAPAVNLLGVCESVEVKEIGDEEVGLLHKQISKSG